MGTDTFRYFVRETLRLTYKMQSAKKYKLANFVNCWNRFRGTKSNQVYFVVLT